MNTNRKDIIQLSLKDKNYNPEQNTYFKEHRSIPLSELEKTLKTKNFSTIQWKTNKRDKELFQAASGFVVDIDKGKTTIQEAEAVLKAKNLNYALITSKSHTPEQHCFHIILPFDRKVYTLKNYQSVIERIEKDLFPSLDKNTKDGARFIFGSKDDSIFSCYTSGENYQVDTEKNVSNAWDDDFEITLPDGTIETAVKVKDSKQPIYCPFHNDSSPSAFISYSEKSFNHYIRCSACGKTYWKSESEDVIIKKTKRFWSLGTSIYEAGIVGDVFSLENISDKKFFVKVGAFSKEDKSLFFSYIVLNKHLHRLNRIDSIGDPKVEESTFNIDMENVVITVSIKALAAKIQDNQFIETYLEKTFGEYKEFIKQWLAVYTYTNYNKLPTLILTGERGVGKNTFAESVQAIYPALSETAKELDGNFNTFAEKKLLLIDESASNGKIQYQLLKKFSGQKDVKVNKKYTPEYMVRNNLNIIFLSNDDLPIYVERDEVPTDERNNQFFVYKMKPQGLFDAQMQQKIIDRLGHYIRTELKTLYDTLDLSGYRYSIPVPITDEEKKLFNNSITDIEVEADRIIDYIESNISNSCWSDYEFFHSGYIPTRAFDDIIKSFRVNKIKVIQNLQKRGYIANEKAGKYIQIGGKRPTSYKLGNVWMDMVQQNQTPKVPRQMFTDGQNDRQICLEMDTTDALNV